eukprot:2045491-Rhodomonas_salina.1
MAWYKDVGFRGRVGGQGMMGVEEVAKCASEARKQRCGVRRGIGCCTRDQRRRREYGSTEISVGGSGMVVQISVGG